MARPSFAAGCDSLAKRFLTNDVFEGMASARTARGVTVADVVRPGETHGSGVLAGDAECYSTFAALLDPVAEACVPGLQSGSRQARDLDPAHLNATKLGGAADGVAVSTRLRLVRNFEFAGAGGAGEGALLAGMSAAERVEVEAATTKALESLSGSGGGYYTSFADAGAADGARASLGRKGLGGDEAPSDAADPAGRGVFCTQDGNLAVWANCGSEQLQIVSARPDGDVGAAFGLLARAASQLEQAGRFRFDGHLGFVASEPALLGLGLTASVTVKTPLTAGREGEAFAGMLADKGLSISKDVDAGEGAYTVSCTHRYGISEVECVQKLHDGVALLVESEQQQREAQSKAAADADATEAKTDEAKAEAKED